MAATDDAENTIQRVRLEQFRDNLEGALNILREAEEESQDLRYRALASQIRSTLSHLDSREAYAAAYERFYWIRKGQWSLKRLERDLRILIGRKTRKTVRRLPHNPEFRLLEREIAAAGAKRVLDAGCGEGRVALTIAARHPGMQVDGIEVSPTNVNLARRMNRFANASFHQGFLEDAPRSFGRGVFDVVYAFGVLEHVSSGPAAVQALMRSLRPGGRLCFVVPMTDFVAAGPLPEPTYEDGVAGHVRMFTEEGLVRAFGGHDGFVLEKLAGELPRRYPATLVPREFGSYFVAMTRPSGVEAW